MSSIHFIKSNSFLLKIFTITWLFLFSAFVFTSPGEAQIISGETPVSSQEKEVFRAKPIRINNKPRRIIKPRTAAAPFVYSATHRIVRALNQKQSLIEINYYTNSSVDRLDVFYLNFFAAFDETKTVFKTDRARYLGTFRTSSGAVNKFTIRITVDNLILEKASRFRKHGAAFHEVFITRNAKTIRVKRGRRFQRVRVPKREIRLMRFNSDLIRPLF